MSWPFRGGQKMWNMSEILTDNMCCPQVEPMFNELLRDNIAMCSAVGTSEVRVLCPTPYSLLYLISPWPGGTPKHAPDRCKC